MEVSLVGNEISIFEKNYEQIFRKEEMLDCVVPDVMPDIGEILDVTSCVFIRSKDVSQGRVKIEAECVLSVLFTPENGEGVFILPVTLPFYISAEDSFIHAESRCIAELTLAAAEAKMINSRKIFARAELAAQLSCYEEKILCVTSDALCEQPLCKRSSEVTITPVTCIEEKAFVITEDYQIPAAKGEITKILSKTVSITPQEAKTVGSKIVFRGTISTNLCCLNSRDEIEGLDFVSSFSQVVETGCERDVSHTALSLMPSAFYADISSNGSDHSISIQAHVVAQLTCMENRSISCLADVYSNTCKASVRFREDEYFCAKSPFSRRETVREIIECDSGSKIISCRAMLSKPSVVGGEIIAEGEMRVLYCQPDGLLRRISRRICVKSGFDIRENEELRVDCVCMPEWSSSPTMSGIEVRAVVCMEGAVFEKVALCSIENISLSEYEGSQADLPSAVILRASSADSLWEIAKNNRSTVELIRSVNHLDEASEVWKKFILVPCMTR